MEEKNLTDEEIVKALECCAVEPCEDCGNCPRFTKEKLCHKANAKQSLDLIHRLQDEIEQLKCKSYCTSWKAKFLEAKKEIERLTEENERFDKLLGEKRLDELNTARQIVAQNCVLNEENTELQKQVDELKERAKIDLENEKNWGKIQTRQAVKDTAKEILTELIERAHSNGCIDLTVNEVKAWFREDYGVEV